MSLKGPKTSITGVSCSFLVLEGEKTGLLSYCFDLSFGSSGCFLEKSEVFLEVIFWVCGALFRFGFYILSIFSLLIWVISLSRAFRPCDDGGASLLGMIGFEDVYFLTTLVMHLRNPPAEVLEFIPYWHNYPPPKFMPWSITARPLLFEFPLSFDLIISLSLPVLSPLTRNPRAAGPLPITSVST